MTECKTRMSDEGNRTQRAVESAAMADGKGKSVNLPLREDRWAVFHAEFPLTEEEWDQMIAILKAMKPGLVKRAPAEQPVNLMEPDEFDIDPPCSDPLEQTGSQA